MKHSQTLPLSAMGTKCREQVLKALAPSFPPSAAMATWTTMLGEVLRVTVLGEPVGKPRMTQRDKWAERPAVVKYRAWADRARATAPSIILEPKDVSWTAYFDLPASYSKKKRAALAGQPHRLKPDRDNMDKAVLDSLFAQDCTVSDGTLRKRWDDGRGPRIEITITT